MRRLFWLILAAALGPLDVALAQLTNALELRDGDRVVFVGDTLIEREQRHGYVEHLIVTRYPDRDVTCRNLGWSADTPEGVARAGFDHDKPPAVWFEQLTNQIAQAQPGVVFLGYGMASSFAGEAGLPQFIAGLERLMDAIQKNAGGTKVRFVLISPVKHQKLPPPLPDPAPHNAQLALYARAIKELAARRDTHYVNLFEYLDWADSLEKAGVFLTDDGIHLNAHGYRRMAEIVAVGLGWDAHVWRVGLLKDGSIREGSYGTEVLEKSQATNGARLVTLDQQLVLPPWDTNEAPVDFGAPMCRWQTLVLNPGSYDLLIDGQFVKTATDRDCKSGLAIDSGPQWEQSEALRQAILWKNELFFHRWRPQNNTYLFLFRKHEQGQNAQEIPRFDPLIEEQEKKIAQLRRPVKHTLELVPSTGARQPPTRVVKPPPALPAVPPLPAPQFDLDANVEISLYAENPLLAKPIHMNFDPQGRLWVASSEVYPQIQPGQEATDKILVLEDTDGDGRAEKSTVFADGLLIPTGVEPGDGGCYVGQSTELLHLRDTDGDGRADRRRVVLSAFGTEDTHHILHSLRWGPEGQLYMNQSIYIHTHVETPHGVVRLNSGGILALRPPTMELGIHLKGLVNPWGHAFDAFGQSFATDGASSAEAGQGGIFHVVPQAMCITYAGARRTLPSVSPGSYPKFCGLETLRSPHFPDDWQGSFVTCDFRAHRVVRFAIREKDSAYVTEAKPDLVRTKDVAFRPIDVKIGPDGALYIADWSNPIIQHGEVDFRDPRRDHEHGRIWRVTFKGRPLVPKPKLPEASNTELLSHLTSASDFNRTQARRVLSQRGTNMLAVLDAWAKRQTNELARLEALWLYQAVDRVAPDLLEQLLAAQDGRVRAAAVRVLAAWQERLPPAAPTLVASSVGWAPAPLPLPHRREIASARALDLLAKAVADDHPRVRLEALRALARIPTARAAELALSAADRPLDGHLDYALWLTINDLAEPWLAALKSGAWKIEGREKQLAFGLRAVEPAKASAVLGQLLGGKPLPKDGSGPWIELIGQAGGAKELRRLLDQILAAGFEDAAAARAIAALGQAARLRDAQPGGDLAGLTALFDHANESVRVEAVRLAGAWKAAGRNLPRLLALAGDPAATVPLREAAFAALRDIGGDAVVDGLTPLCAKGVAPAIRRQAAAILCALKLDQGAPLAVEVLADTAAEADALALWRSVLTIKGASAAFTKALAKATLPPAAGKAGLRAAREGGRNEPDLILALTRSAGLEAGETALTDAELKQLAADVTRKGDAARGEAVYRRKELSCLACHAIGGAGGKVGPDLTSIGASVPVDYLVESVWFPNKTIKEGFHAVQVETKDGDEFSGVLVREDAMQLVLRDATTREIAVPKATLKSRAVSNTSLMPAGLLDALGGQERLDLFRFLSELGKPGPFDATQGSVARVWRVRTGLHTQEQFGEETVLRSDLTSTDWTPVVARVDGSVPVDDLKESIIEPKYRPAIALYAAAQLQVAGTGPVKLKLTAPPDTPVWIDGKPASARSEITAELDAGTHTIVVRLDPRKLPDPLRLEASAGTFVGN
jgi:putative membrane-bound dehydrogenase-like protein